MKEVLLSSDGTFSPTDTRGVFEGREQECKQTCKKILELLGHEKISVILSDEELQNKLHTFKRFLGNYLLGDYDDDGIGYLIVNDDDQFYSLRCLYDYGLIESELGRFWRSDSCVNMDFDGYKDMCVIVSKEINTICLVEVTFESSESDRNFENPDCCFKTKVGIFKSDGRETISSSYLLKGKGDFESGNIKLEDEKIQARLKTLIKGVNLY